MAFSRKLTPPKTSSVDSANQVVNQQGGFVKIWIGSQAEYDAIGAGNYDANTLYFIEEVV